LIVSLAEKSMNKIPVRHIDEPAFSENFIIREIHMLLQGKDMVQELHRHNFFFILALEKGKGKHVIDFTSYKITNHSVFLMKPGQVHALILKKGSTGFLLQFNPDFASSEITQLLQLAGNNNYYQFNLLEFKKIATVLTSVFSELTNKQEQHQKALKAYLEIFLIELTRKNKNLKILSKKQGGYAQERLDNFLALLESNFQNMKQVSHYADLLNVTSYQLNATTRELLGKTCSEVVNERIILEAKRYLLATSNQINHIADQLGYEDISYFIRFFKKHTSYSPQAFRENFK
jgi:AraC-like DNA-binding protein